MLKDPILRILKNKPLTKSQTISKILLSWNLILELFNIDFQYTAIYTRHLNVHIIALQSDALTARRGAATLQKLGGVQIDFEGGGVVDEVRKFEGG